jgi:transcriptional regulator with XRE-family HTH domain
VDAAAILGVDPKTLMWWERGEREPFIHAFPALISYLGYEPWEEPTTLAEALLAERRRRGLSRAAASSLIGVDEGTLWRWETEQWKVLARSLGALKSFLGVAAEARFPTAVRVAASS